MGPVSLPLSFEPALSAPSLVAPPVYAALRTLPGADQIRVAAIDPALADTAAFCERYGVPPEESANCVVIAAKRGGETTYAACVVAATTRADVNGLVRRHLGARKASFGPVDTVTALTGMEYGGITPIGLPADWPVLVDAAVDQGLQAVAPQRAAHNSAHRRDFGRPRRVIQACDGRHLGSPN
jgi:prolyl-tRNA editing enzyme YbaK/EbsC (Cys-tRNA(Pro) deacylase)